jgi:hypothetical protein
LRWEWAARCARNCAECFFEMGEVGTGTAAALGFGFVALVISRAGFDAALRRGVRGWMLGGRDVSEGS